MTIEPTRELVAHVYLDTCTGQQFVTSEKIEKRTLHEYIGQVTIKPEEVTNPKPELPSEPGVYLTSYNTVWQLGEDGTWTHNRVVIDPHAYPEAAPFTRLVTEKPPVTAKEIYGLLDFHFDGVTDAKAQAVADYINKR